MSALLPCIFKMMKPLRSKKKIEREKKEDEFHVRTVQTEQEDKMVCTDKKQKVKMIDAQGKVIASAGVTKAKLTVRNKWEIDMQEQYALGRVKELLLCAEDRPSTTVNAVGTEYAHDDPFAP